MSVRLALAVALLALAGQWLLWPWLAPFAGFLFFPAVFFSAYLAYVGGRASERRRAAAQLRQSEIRFEATFEQAAVGIALVAPDGRWLRANQKLCEIVGYAHDELLAKTFHDITHADDVDADLAQMRQMLAGEISTYALEKRCRRKDGGVVWVNLTVALVRRADGAPDYFIAVIEDIQRRKQAEAALQATASALQAAQRLAGIGNWRWEVCSGAHVWSEEIYRIYGRDLALPPAVYPEVQQYFTAESWLRLAACVERALADGASYECDAEVLRPDGGRRWIVARGEADRNTAGQVTGLHGTVQDITARKAAEEALRNSEAMYRSLFDNMLNGFAYCRVLFKDGVAEDFIYLSVNAAFATLTGLDGVVGRKVSEVIPGILQTDAELLAIYGRVALGAGPERFERYVYALDMWFWIAVYSPKPEHFVAIFDVITERKRAEAEILRLNAGLERRVAERTAELLAANQELDAFAYAVSHDLRAPLRAMSGFSQALLEDCGGLLQGEALVYLQQIDLASRKMGELIDGLLVLSRSTRGELRYDAVDISALARQVLAELAKSEPGRQVDAQVEDGLKARGDVRMVEIVLRNLLANAWKYTANTAKPHIRLYAAGRRFCVADNGAGFDMAHANRLFQPFQRLHRQEEFPGIGIGLATVQRIIHRHGGTIEAQAAPGKGAVFCFSLPDIASGEAEV